MKKYIRLTCSVCRRTTDKPVDNARFTPDKCTITLSCTGRLQPVEYISNAMITTQPETGVADWRPRGSVSTLVSTSTDQQIEATSGVSKQLVLACELSTAPASDSIITGTFKIQNETPATYRHFIFRLNTTFNSISGIESGIEKKTLRYNSTDVVKILLNGVEILQGIGEDEYQVYDGSDTSPVTPNTIRFNKEISSSGITQVDVIVSQAITLTETPVSFFKTKNDSSRPSGAWENIDFVQKFENGVWKKLYLFNLDIDSDTALKLNSILIAPSSFQINGANIPASKVDILLARKPFTHLDRRTNVVVNLSDLQGNPVKYFVDNGERFFTVPKSSATTVFPPLRPSKFNAESLIISDTAGIDEQTPITQTIIVGPAT